MILWLICGAITLVVVAGLLIPILRRPPVAAARRDFDLTVYRDQLAEIERDLARGLLSPDQGEAARTEVERRILALDATGRDGTAREGRARRNPLLAAGLVVVVPAAGLGLYLALGSPEVPNLPLAERRGEAPGGPDLVGLADGLAQRLARGEGEVADWLLLGRTYAELGRYGEAAEVTREAIARGADDIETQGFYGQVLVSANEGRVVPAARQAFARVLEQDMGNPRALYFAGLALAQDGRDREALDLWLALARASQPDAPYMPLLRQQIERVSAALGIEPPALAARPTPSPGAAPEPGTAPGPSQADVEAASEMSDADRSAFIRNMVARLAERLESEPDDLDGWLRLVRAYTVLGETDKAEAALARAEALAAELPADAPQRAAVETARQALEGAD